MHPSLLAYVVADRQRRFHDEAAAHHRAAELRTARQRRRWRLQSPIVRRPIAAPVRTAAPGRAQASIAALCP
jgi:hypothetical protein